jgi:hypothetical protein
MIKAQVSHESYYSPEPPPTGVTSVHVLRTATRSAATATDGRFRRKLRLMVKVITAFRIVNASNRGPGRPAELRNLELVAGHWSKQCA